MEIDIKKVNEAIRAYRGGMGLDKAAKIANISGTTLIKYFSVEDIEKHEERCLNNVGRQFRIKWSKEWDHTRFQILKAGARHDKSEFKGE